jgi:hypothetical protein
MIKTRTIKATGPSGVPTVIHQGLELGPASADFITVAGNALAVSGFRGSVTFEVFDERNSLMWTTVIQYSDDCPNGYWQNTLNNATSFSQ